MAVLELRDVAVRFGSADAVAGVSLSVHAGEVVGLIGPNGAGKTVTFNVVTGLQRPTRGAVFLHGRDVTAAAPHERTALRLGRTVPVRRAAPPRARRSHPAHPGDPPQTLRSPAGHLPHRARGHRASRRPGR